MTYLRLARLPVGLLVNFNVIVLKTALRRLTPEHPSSDLPTFLFQPIGPSLAATPTAHGGMRGFLSPPFSRSHFQRKSPMGSTGSPSSSR